MRKQREAFECYQSRPVRSCVTQLPPEPSYYEPEPLELWSSMTQAVRFSAKFDALKFNSAGHAVYFAQSSYIE